jgi:putrescine transport system ATP-binding protein
VIDCTDLRHYVGHGITGSLGMPVSVAVRPEKIQLSVDEPGDDDHAGQVNCVRGTVKNLSYFGSFTVYHLELASGRVLKISQNNTQRHREHELTWGDSAWASWSRLSQVVLTQ